MLPDEPPVAPSECAVRAGDGGLDPFGLAELGEGQRDGLRTGIDPANRQGTTLGPEPREGDETGDGRWRLAEPVADFLLERIRVAFRLEAGKLCIKIDTDLRLGHIGLG